MDTVFIRELKVEAIIGIYDWERKNRQPLIFDVEMAWDIKQAAATDDLQYALNYKAVAESIVEFTESTEFLLIETLLEQVAERLLKEFRMPSLKISVDKPVAIENTRTVGLTIERCLSDLKLGDV